jgi:uracil-DNA glycosylase
MADAKDKLRRAARQLIETDLALGGDFMPAHRNPLVVSHGATLDSSASAVAAAPAFAEASAGEHIAAHHGTQSGTQPEPTASGSVARVFAGAAPGAPRQAPAAGSQAPPIDGSTMTRDQKAAALGAIDTNEVRGCTKCRLHTGRTHTVFGEGDPAAALMFIGEGPGEDEDRQGRPFVGRAGQKLNEMIVAMGLRREDVYIANVVKCRPPGNRTPMPDESGTCTELYLVRQIQIIRPKVIVTLGNPATQAMLGAVLGITKIRGKWQKLRRLAEGVEGIPVMPTFHPAYLLRNYTPETRKMVWEDLKKVMELLGLKRR